ncbi:hypothetical protein V1T76_17750 [Roseibium sp. FZY0029]|uniref:hypothetical protein n=1 Tax=Roseibium sp. FZY0029 TaxID=3116647 RepID=UPI002EC9A387|nr:hypothetical protein [Roseibium sp. FZY0029]
MSALMAALKAVLVDWLVGTAGELVRQWRHEHQVKQNVILKAQLNSRKAIDRAQKTSSQRSLDAIRDRLHERAGSR